MTFFFSEIFTAIGSFIIIIGYLILYKLFEERKLQEKFSLKEKELKNLIKGEKKLHYQYQMLMKMVILLGPNHKLLAFEIYRNMSTFLDNFDNIIKNEDFLDIDSADITQKDSCYYLKLLAKLIPYFKKIENNIDRYRAIKLLYDNMMLYVNIEYSKTRSSFKMSKCTLPINFENLSLVEKESAIIHPLHYISHF